MLGANLGLLLYGDVSVMMLICKNKIINNLISQLDDKKTNERVSLRFHRVILILLKNAYQRF